MGAKSAKLLKFLDNPEDRNALNRAFRAYDKDESGELDRQEFSLFANDMVDYFVSKHPNLPVTNFITENYNGKLGELTPLAKKRFTKLLSETMWDIIDTNGDGKISVQEWEATPWASIAKAVKSKMVQKQKMVAKELVGKWKITGELFNGSDTVSLVAIFEVTVSSAFKGSIQTTYILKPSECHITVDRLIITGHEDIFRMEWSLLLDVIDPRVISAYFTSTGTAIQRNPQTGMQVAFPVSMFTWCRI